MLKLNNNQPSLENSGNYLTFRRSMYELQRSIHNLSGYDSREAGDVDLLAHLLGLQLQLLLDVQVLVVHLVVVLQVVGLRELLVARTATVGKLVIVVDIINYA